MNAGLNILYFISRESSMKNEFDDILNKFDDILLFGSSGKFGRAL